MDRAQMEQLEEFAKALAETISISEFESDFERKREAAHGLMHALEVASKSGLLNELKRYAGFSNAFEWFMGVVARWEMDNPSNPVHRHIYSFSVNVDTEQDASELTGAQLRDAIREQVMSMDDDDLLEWFEYSHTIEGGGGDT